MRDLGPDGTAPETPSEDQIDETVEDSFPASDPPSWWPGHDGPRAREADGEDPTEPL